SRDWRAHCARPQSSIRAPRMKFPRPRGLSADAWMNQTLPQRGGVENEMAIYTVHAPASEQTLPDPEHFVFVRDGFYFWAMVLGAVWMLRHRLWFALISYVVLVTLLMIVLSVLGSGTLVKVVAGFLIALLLGFEAATLRRLNLARRGYSNVGL